jgi:hypothetical protein
MTYTFDQSKDEIARLVKHFSTPQQNPAPKPDPSPPSRR